MRKCLAKARRAGWQVLRRVLSHRVLWFRGRSFEIEHWRNYLEWQTYEVDRLSRLDGNTELQTEIKELAGGFPPSRLRILDVGAGPLTRLGKRWGGCHIEIVAIDPLAEEYSKLLHSYGIAPSVSTIFGEAERMVDAGVVRSEYFDIAYAHNSLDHCYNPLAAVDQMLKAVRPGGIVYLDHRVKESTRTAAHGFHQWDFSERGGNFVIDDARHQIDVSERFKTCAEISCTTVERDNSSIGELERDFRVIVILRRHLRP